jgi:DNA-binding transcriptional ArsR family regulator
VARTRFAISPVWELVRSVVALRDPSTAALHLPWLRRLSGRLDGLDLQRVVALIPPRGYMPDFLTPPPDGPLGDIEADLAAVRATPAAQIRFEMDIFIEESNGRKIAEPWLAHPRREANRLTDTLTEYWARAVEPVWPRIRAFLEADLAYRAHRLTTGGLEALFSDLHHSAVWEGDHLDVQSQHTATIELGGRGLLMVPSVFAWSRTVTITEPPWQPTLIYPARGVATLWEESGGNAEGLGRLIGATRASVLVALDAPRSTTELARRLGVTPGGASQHLTALKGAGLVASHREGRSVLYVRTPTGDALVAAAA